ncbi:hypothetical protein DPMN_063485 [Dreissena polymorpha]|uniref:Uncharacterized protein n=1 Tax=Dreissena polymorpha TaxID=45954 RepID=A0A9D4CBM2_DREPO|nr:hypothetical protein DPMN_063485 [Dreissena polymorpha]
MVTTSRTNRFLQVTYGDGHSSKVSLKDTTTPRLVIEGSDQEMDIIASYGDSCTLSLKFYYIYHNEGHFEVNVSVFDGADVNSKKKCYGLKDLEKSSALENLNTDGQNAANSSPCSKKIDNADVKLQDKNVIEGMQSDVDYKLEARFERKILVLNEIAGVKLRGQRLSICGAEVQFQVQMNSKLNVSVHWSIYKMKSEDPDSYHEVEANLSNIVDGEDLEIIEDFLTTATDLFYRIQNEGSYLVHVTASNTLSEAEAVTNVEVQCPIEGLKAVCSSHYLMTGEAIQCAAKVLAGSDVVFRWMVELANDKFANIEGDRLSFVFNHSWIYSFIAIAMNNVSRQSYEIVNVYVQDEITSRDVHVLKMPHTLLGNETALAVVYQPAFVGVNFNELHFELDFGNGRVSPAIVEEDPRCYVQVRYKFSTPGVHQVLVYVYNQVSEYVENITVWVHSDLQSITMETRQVVFAGSPTRFYILRNGKLILCCIYWHVGYNKFLE